MPRMMVATTQFTLEKRLDIRIIIILERMNILSFLFLGGEPRGKK